MAKRFAFKDNKGNLYYRSKRTLEFLKEKPEFKYVLLSKGKLDYWKARFTYWRKKTQRLAFRNNKGKLLYRSKYTLEVMQAKPGFTFTRVHFWKFDYWKAAWEYWRLKIKQIPQTMANWGWARWLFFMLIIIPSFFIMIYLLTLRFSDSHRRSGHHKFDDIKGTFQKKPEL